MNDGYRTSSATLKPELNAWHLWGMAVGLVISGEYFGWSHGWDKAGTLGFIVTTVVVAAMYTTFIFSFTELTTAIPHAGGPLAYACRALGPAAGYVAGLARLIEFVFAPPAIAMAIGAYLNVQFPAVANFVRNGWAGEQQFSSSVIPGIMATIFSDDLVSFGGQSLTANIVTISVFGAIIMYIMAMLSLFVLRKSEPDLQRPFPAEGYPLLPAIALTLAIVCLLTMVYYNAVLALVFAALMGLGFVYFLVTGAQRRAAIDPSIMG